MTPSTAWTPRSDERDFSAHHAAAIVSLLEHQGALVMVADGGYPVAERASDGATTRDTPHVLVWLSGWSRSDATGTTRGWSSVHVKAVGGWHQSRRRERTVATVQLGRECTDREAAVAAGLAHIDAAVAALSTLDADAESADRRIAQGWAYTAPLERSEYEAACAALGVEALSDADCDSYGVRYGSFSFPEYAADYVVRMHLAARRLAALDAAAKAAEAAQPLPEPVVYRWGARGVRYDEACSRCRRVTEVDNHTDLCVRCGSGPLASVV